MQSAEAMFNHVFHNFGLPEDIVSDRGPQFTSRVWGSLCARLGIGVSLSSGYHPQSNGQVERLNQEIGRFLRTYCSREQQHWREFLPWAEYAQNSLIHSSMGLTPFQCILGYQPPLFPWSGEPSYVPAVEEWYRLSQEVWEHAHVGQKVWLSTRNFRLKLPCQKHSPKFIGPFEIVRQINPVVYRLWLPALYRICPTFHISLLKPAHSSAGEARAGEEPLPPLDIQGSPAYQVRALLNSRQEFGHVYSTSWTGRGMASRNARGWMPLTFWIRRSLRTSTMTTQISPLRVRGGALGVEPREAFLEGGALSRPARQPTARGSPCPCFDFTSGSPLCKSGVSDEGCSALTSALRLNPSHLRELDLSYNNVGKSGVKCLSAVLENPYSKLKKLWLWDCGVSDDSCAALTSALRSNPSHLRDLNLSENKLGDSGVKCLSAVLENPHCKLEKLGMRKCGVSNEGCAALTSALRSNPSHLRELDLSNNNVGDSGVKSLSAVLENLNCKLEKLVLCDCGVSDEGCAALTSALKSNPSHLRELNLFNNKIGDTGKNLLSALTNDEHYRLRTLRKSSKHKDPHLKLIQLQDRGTTSVELAQE
ncbi:hypothetical protein QTP70_012952 [Hemibagrus guttatus]|uniref:Integrase catalytic domain-containing protein n=1 Tax=Hemibagrus guttatus TaxID=175788 RepID=A0AAE0URR1_9TELE|nr:hypothetical protein QTP70_012952 [Hemibagrus guttatus]